MPDVRKSEVTRKMEAEDWVTVPTELGRALLSAPEPTACIRLFSFSAMALVLAIGLLAGFNGSRNDPAYQAENRIFVFWPAVFAFTLAGLLFLGGIAAYVHRAPVRRGSRMAEEVCARGWFCAHCAVVYFQPGDEPAGADAEHAYSVQEFRQMVFSAGGYGDRA